MKNHTFLALLPLLAACGAEPPTLNLDYSTIPLSCYTDQFSTGIAELKSPRGKNAYTFSFTDNGAWVPVRCATQFPVYVSADYTETRVPINVIDWGEPHPTEDGRSIPKRRQRHHRS